MRFAILFFLSFSSFVHAQDVIIGRDAAPLNGEVVSDTFMFFNKAKGALRAPALINSKNWSPDSMGIFSIALGINALALDKSTIALGNNARAYSNGAIAMGAYAKASSLASISIGQYSKASGTGSLALGYSTRALSNYAVALGHDTRANGTNSTSIGYNNNSDGWFSVSVGRDLQASSFGEVVLGGYNNIVTPLSPYDWAAEDRLLVLGNGQDGGLGGNIRSDAMVVLKNGDVRFPDGSLLVGRDSMPKNGERVTGEMFFYDKNRTAFRGGSLDFSRKWEPDSLGYGSFAYGVNVKATDNYSIATGSQTTASGSSSFATGSQTTASGLSSFASGRKTNASGLSSFATGSQTTASGKYSFASGRETAAKSYAEFSIGSYNTDYIPNNTSDWNAMDRLFVIGNGSNSINLSDAMVVLKNGNTTISGETTISNPTESQLIFDRSSPGSYDAKIRVGTTGNMYFEGGADKGNGLNTNMVLRSDGRLGIRNSNPDKEFHVTGQAKIQAFNSGSDANFFMQSGTGVEGRVLTFQKENEDIYIGDIDNVGNNIFIRAGGGDRITILDNGNVGIGENAPSVKLDVNGSICYIGSVTACSDIRYKKNFTPISNALSKVNQLNGLYYDWNTLAFPEKEFSNARQIGVIAQEVEEFFPEMVMTNEEGYKSVDYSRLTPVLIEAMKELTEKNEKLSREVNDLKNSQKEILKAFADLKKHINK